MGLALQLRDLRLLDPQLALSYPSAILCRERALVVNLEHIKCIITTENVLVLNADEENVIAFIEELQRRLAPPHPDQVPKVGANGEAIQEDVNLGARATVEETPFELRALEVALDTVSCLPRYYSMIHTLNLTMSLHGVLHTGREVFYAGTTSRKP